MSPLIEKQVLEDAAEGKKRRPLIPVVLALAAFAAVVLTVLLIIHNTSGNGGNEGGERSRKDTAESSRDVEETSSEQEETEMDPEETNPEETEETASEETDPKTEEPPAIESEETESISSPVPHTEPTDPAPETEPPPGTDHNAPGAETVTEPASTDPAADESGSSDIAPPDAYRKFQKVSFGPYEWYVLDWNETGVLLFSVGSVEAVKYDQNGSGDWEKSSIRAWLNSTFLNRFSPSEQEMIRPVTLTTSSSGRSITTRDKAFLLDYMETYRYLVSSSAGAPDAIRKGDPGEVFWWIRGVSEDTAFLYAGFEKGDADAFTWEWSPEEYNLCRPALWVQIN